MIERFLFGGIATTTRTREHDDDTETTDDGHSNLTNAHKISLEMMRSNAHE